MSQSSPPRSIRPRHPGRAARSSARSAGARGSCRPSAGACSSRSCSWSVSACWRRSSCSWCSTRRGPTARMRRRSSSAPSWSCRSRSGAPAAPSAAGGTGTSPSLGCPGSLEPTGSYDAFERNPDRPAALFHAGGSRAANDIMVGSVPRSFETGSYVYETWAARTRFPHSATWVSFELRAELPQMTIVPGPWRSWNRPWKSTRGTATGRDRRHVRPPVRGSRGPG